MRVGLLVGNLSPSLGGGYTYQQDLFRSFLEVAASSRHEYHVLCEPGRAQEFEREFAGLPNVRAAPMAPSRVPHRARTALQVLMRSLQYQSDFLSREARVGAEKGLHLLWSLGHYMHQAFDFPYITPVLDMQHRIQPWFPEVSHGREWQHREDYFQDYLRRAAYVLTGTEEGRREIEHFYGVAPERIRVLPLATPRFALEGAALDVEGRLAALGLKPGYLFYPAQFWPHKNHANLLHALRLLHDEYGLPYELVLAGSDHGNEAYVRKVAAELRLERHVRFLGFVPQEDLVALYRGADALAYVTFFGPDNLPPLEAFALGCPVVASEVPGAREQLGPAALLVRGDSPRGIAEGIKRLREDAGLRESLREQGRRRAASWTGKDYIRGILAIIDEFDAIRRCWA
jgi:glycosyltransferase involved in cell wall biosynthesis